MSLVARGKGEWQANWPHLPQRQCTKIQIHFLCHAHAGREGGRQQQLRVSICCDTLRPVDNTLEKPNIGCIALIVKPLQGICLSCVLFCLSHCSYFGCACNNKHFAVAASKSAHTDTLTHTHRHTQRFTHTHTHQ